MVQAFDLRGFEKRSKEDWDTTVSRELNLQNPMGNFRWSHDSVIQVDPIYFPSDVSSFSNSISQNRKIKGWQNLARIDPGNPGDALTLTKKLNLFCDGLILDFSKVHEIKDKEKLEQILTDKPHIHFSGLCPQTLKDMLPIINRSLSGSLGLDPIGNNDEAQYSMYDLFDHQELHNISIIKIGGDKLTRSGASIVQEVGTVLSMLVEYLNQLSDKGVDTNTCLNKIEISTAIGQDFFHEVAKLRAYRILINAVAQEFGKPEHYVKINATINVRDISDIKENDSLIRNTIAAMAATLGGCDTIHIHPHNYGSIQDHQLTLNISNLLKEESYFSKVVNPAEGSYYVENLTDMISKAAWSFFQEIEGLGGFVQARNSGWLENQFSGHKKWLQKKTEDRSYEA